MVRVHWDYITAIYITSDLEKFAVISKRLFTVFGQTFLLSEEAAI